MRPSRKNFSSKLLKTTLSKNLAIVLAFLCFWQLVVIVGKLPFYILPPPFAVALVLKKQGALIFWHMILSLCEVLGGLALGLVLGISSALAIDRFSLLRLVLQPLIVGLQSIPMFALMPVLLIWFGYGLLPKMVVVGLSCFVPIALCFIDGLKNTAPELVAMGLVMKATPWQFFKFIKYPAALPSLLSGVRIAAIHAPVAVIAADWIGASDGLGYLIMLSYGRMDLDFMFACIFCLIFMSLVFKYVLAALEKKLLFWL